MHQADGCAATDGKLVQFRPLQDPPDGEVDLEQFHENNLGRLSYFGL